MLLKFVMHRDFICINRDFNYATSRDHKHRQGNFAPFTQSSNKDHESTHDTTI